MNIIMKKSGQHGLTLVEVVLTALIVSLLASVAALGVQRYLEDGKTQVANADLATLKSAVRLYILDNGTPASFSAANLVPGYLPEIQVDPFSKNSLQYVIEIHNGRIYIGSRGPDGEIDYGETGKKDDIYYYIQ